MSETASVKCTIALDEPVEPAATTTWAGNTLVYGHVP